MNKFQYRYINRNGFFIPEFSKDGEKWGSFNREFIEDKILDLHTIADNLAELSCETTSKWGANKWYFRDTGAVFFLKEIAVNAFLAAAKFIIEKEDQIIIPFEITIQQK